MIARIWRGWAPLATADDYQRHYETEVSGHLRAVSGFRGARLLRRDYGPEVMFTSIAFFISLDVIRGFAGDDYELAIVEEAARQALSRWDERVSHLSALAECREVSCGIAAYLGASDGKDFGAMHRAHDLRAPGRNTGAQKEPVEVDALIAQRIALVDADDRGREPLDVLLSREGRPG